MIEKEDNDKKEFLEELPGRFIAKILS